MVAIPQAAAPAVGRLRYQIVLIIFIVTVINYADRAIVSIVGAPMSKELGISAVALGYIFSAFSWSYVAAQIPGGWLLDRYGSKPVYGFGILLWSLFTLAQGFVGFLTGAAAVAFLFVFRFLVGLAEAPSFPGNARIVAAWFPNAERGKASAIFNSAQYFAPVLFAPLGSFITQSLGWSYSFFVMGLLGVAVWLAWGRMMHGPRQHPSIGEEELAYLERGGALMQMDGHIGKDQSERRAFAWSDLRQLLGSRMLLGVYIAQYCINVITYFFLTWFPIYLIKDRGMSILGAGFVASLPALCGFIGGVLGGVISDALYRRSNSLTLARKLPIIAGMLLSMIIVLCNYVESPVLVIMVMALAFFGKGVGSLGWAVVSDTSPKEIGGLSGGLFNMFGNAAGITTPIIIGYMIQHTGSFNAALVFVGANAFVAMASYLFLVGEIRRVELRT